MSIETKHQRLLQAVEAIDPSDMSTILAAKAIARAQREFESTSTVSKERIDSARALCEEDDYGAMYWATLFLPPLLAKGSRLDETDHKYLQRLLSFIDRSFLFRVK